MEAMRLFESLVMRRHNPKDKIHTINTNRQASWLCTWQSQTRIPICSTLLQNIKCEPQSLFQRHHCLKFFSAWLDHLQHHVQTGFCILPTQPSWAPLTVQVSWARHLHATLCTMHHEQKQVVSLTCVTVQTQQVLHNQRPR